MPHDDRVYLQHIRDAAKRKALTPNDNSTLQDLARRILLFQQRFEEIAKPFEWKFTRHDLTQLMGRVLQHSVPFARSA
jgi:hypothetical protein